WRQTARNRSPASASPRTSRRAARRVRSSPQSASTALTIAASSSLLICCRRTARSVAPPAPDARIAASRRSRRRSSSWRRCASSVAADPGSPLARTVSSVSSARSSWSSSASPAVGSARWSRRCAAARRLSADVKCSSGSMLRSASAPVSGSATQNARNRRSTSSSRARIDVRSEPAPRRPGGVNPPVPPPPED
ncbi:MAG: hypothetical protein AVDCRST_MAG85-2862, partial [uncultured Solirubrobacteraceae bacterium]